MKRKKAIIPRKALEEQEFFKNVCDCGDFTYNKDSVCDACRVVKDV